MKKILGFSFLLIVLFSGCAIQQPDIPKYTINKNDKIGYIINIPKKVEHSHVGTTAFNNFEKSYLYAWEKEGIIEKQLHDNLGQELINLSLLGFKNSDFKDLIVGKDNKWVINNKTLYQKLVNDLKLKAIIVITDGPGSFFLNPYVFDVKGTGLVSSNFLGIKRFFAVLSVESQIYLFNPLAKINVNRDPLVTIIYDPMLNSFEEKSGFKIPNNIENITQSEMEPVNKMNNIHLNGLINKTIEYLNK